MAHVSMLWARLLGKLIASESVTRGPPKAAPLTPSSMLFVAGSRTWHCRAMPPNLLVNIELRGGRKFIAVWHTCNVILYLNFELGGGGFSNLTHSTAIYTHVALKLNQIQNLIRHREISFPLSLPNHGPHFGPGFWNPFLIVLGEATNKNKFSVMAKLF